ncbi:MAG: hypothetical protein KBT03_11095 [Bacteroidales bacterium]|nr:hypothetical protein [Candidatus Scybalousia scybalohippi]
MWGNIVKEDEIVVKASAIGVGANKPIRSTSGWSRFGGSIYKVGHGVKMDEDDLLKMQEIAASNMGKMEELMIDSMIAKSDKLVIGIHNKITSWLYEGLSTGVINDFNEDGILVQADLMIPDKYKAKPNSGKGWFTISGSTWTPNAQSDPIQDMLDAQQFAEDENLPFDHWEITKTMYRKLMLHPSVIAKCRNHMSGIANTNYTLVESEILSVMHEFGVAPFRVIDEKSAKEINGISEVDTASFEPTSLVLCNSGSGLFEIKNARSVYEERVAAGPQQTGQYSFTGENNAIAILNQWQESPVCNIFESELWAFPILSNPLKSVLIFNCQDNYTFPTV